MKKINLSSQPDYSAWEYLPEHDTLSQYLNSSDIIMLSMVCKNYRKQLLVLIFSKLNLVGFPLAYNGSYLYKCYWNAVSLDSSLGVLKFILDSKLLNVREVTLDSYFNSKFSKKFVNFLPNITKLIFYPAYIRVNLSTLSTILNGLKQLKHVEFNIELDEEINFNTRTQVFPQSLTSIRINTPIYAPSFLRIFRYY
ncbi:hypothetical protein CONCODRAFT_12711 [Conidiobolus coronatus NRRL 28638]|uniref:F-box domain-containing protein n=1 Tax=Conidiobolus coronatus (strain ATCC 28846 / CBS 209.66 / NRRL 28638) TaxID=796925 RepID=A0A137NS89_CONC2|nr:hypothetical protein CONCODRAFT_12711 [Conidiobolus coronatus NRRL 28638]|eukprot:KXN65633.1 hypothetical protein CONCODRAFT_12711 [Conidiobolus coronatus NRRL 28638]